MYSTCIFCHADLGANEALENFQVGRRLAFDLARGRLWVVCRRCGRWNLSPLEERWEAVEEMEKRFRETRLRVSTENIGLARLGEGTQLVRVGAPLRPELAAWRYGDRFGQRRRRALTRAGLGVGALGAIAVGGVAAGVSLGAFWWFGQSLFRNAVYGSPDTVVARVPTGAGPVEVKRKHLNRVQLLPGGAHDWQLLLPLRAEQLRLEGEDAVRAAGVLLPPMNRFAGSRREVDDAVRLLDEAGAPERAFSTAARLPGKRGMHLDDLDRSVRLALEMAAHEEAERQALEGELLELERAWREAEEIAAIADRLTLPPAVERALEALRLR